MVFFFLTDKETEAYKAQRCQGSHSSWQLRSGILTTNLGLHFNRGIGRNAEVFYPVDFWAEIIEKDLYIFGHRKAKRTNTWLIEKSHKVLCVKKKKHSMKFCIFTRFLSVHVKAQKKVWKGAPDWQKWLLRELGVWWGEIGFICEVHTSFFNN